MATDDPPKKKVCTPGLATPGWLVLLRVPGAQAGKGTVEPGEPPKNGARFQPKPEPDEATPGSKRHRKPGSRGAGPPSDAEHCPPTKAGRCARS